MSERAVLLEFDAVIQKAPDQDAAYVAVPVDLRARFGKGRLPVSAEFDGAAYDGSVVNMGLRNPDGTVCYVLGVRKDLRARIGKQPGDSVHVVLRLR